MHDRVREERALVLILRWCSVVGGIVLVLYILCELHRLEMTINAPTIENTAETSSGRAGRIYEIVCRCSWHAPMARKQDGSGGVTGSRRSEHLEKEIETSVGPPSPPSPKDRPQGAVGVPDAARRGRVRKAQGA